MRKIKIISYDSVKGKGEYMDSKTLDLIKFRYKDFYQQKAVPIGVAYVDDKGIIHKTNHNSFFKRLFRRTK